MESLSHTRLCADTDLQKAGHSERMRRVQQPEQSVSHCKRQSQSDGEHAVQMDIALSTESLDFCPVKGEYLATVYEQSHEQKQCYPWSLFFSLEIVLCWYLLFLSL